MLLYDNVTYDMWANGFPWVLDFGNYCYNFEVAKPLEENL